MPTNRTSRHSLACVLAIPLLLSACAKAEPGTAAAPGKAHKINHVLLITVDTWRFDRVGLHADLVKTPNIDRFAGQALHFMRAYSHNPCTLPAHANILTGTTPLNHGISDNSGFRLEPRFFTMAEFFKQRNWTTAAFIAAFPLDSRFGLDQGFDVYDEQYKSHSEHEGFFSERPADAVIDSFIAWADQPGRPENWFSWIHLFDPHQPYSPPQPFAGQYSQDPYSGEVAYTDQQLGRLWDWLRQKGLYDDTLIVLTGDHGEGLEEHGERTHAYFAYNSTIHIPLFMRIPGVEAEIIQENVCHSDIFPTVCQALGLPAPDRLPGRSLLTDRAGLADRAIYFESLTPFYNRSWAPLRGYIRADDKYIDLPLQELYDLDRDPAERTNLVRGLNWKAHRQALQELIRSQINPDKPERLQGAETDPKVVLRLQSLGYLPGDQGVKKTVFLPKDDLKTLLPLQNLMLDGMACEQNDRPEQAIALFDQVIRQRQDFILTYTLMASIYKKAYQFDKAVDILNRGLAANPDNIFLLAKLGILLAEYGRPDEAIAVLEKAIAQQDSDPETYTYLGVAYHRKKDFDRALAQFEKGLTLDRSNALLHNNIGAVYLEKYLQTRDDALFEKAMAAFNQALGLDSRLHSALNGRGAAYSFRNQPELAMADWRDAIAAKSDFPDPYFNLAVLLNKQGQKEQALETLLACQKNCQRSLSQGYRQQLERMIAGLTRR